MTKEELKKYCEGEFAGIDRVTTELFTVYKAGRPDVALPEMAAIAAFVVNLYGGIENILKQMLIFDKLDVGDSPDWHEKVLKKAGEIGILPHELLQVLVKYLEFRNYFIYTYIFNIQWNDLSVLVETVKDVIAQFRKEVNEYLQVV